MAKSSVKGEQYHTSADVVLASGERSPLGPVDSHEKTAPGPLEEINTKNKRTKGGIPPRQYQFCPKANHHRFQTHFSCSRKYMKREFTRFLPKHFQSQFHKEKKNRMQFHQQGHCTMSQPGIPDQVLQHLNHIRYIRGKETHR